jgi:aminopeptidase N
MESKPVAAWHPEWKQPQDDALDLDAILNVDAGRVTRTIRAEADTPAQINEMFDGITYQKGAAVLAMVENYVGQETFQRGVHKYLLAHMYANATAEDFWNAQTAVSHKPVDKIMQSFVALPGVPLLRFSASAHGATQASQQRFFLSPDAKQPAQAQLWTIPVCFQSTNKPKCDLLDSAQQTLKVPSAKLFFANAGDKGYYRTLYAPVDNQAITDNIESALTPVERIGFAGNAWALMRSGHSSVADYMNLAERLRNDPNAAVVLNVANALQAVGDRIASGEDRTRLAAWVRAQFGPAYARQKLLPPAASQEQRQLRATLFSVLGILGRDPQIIAEAQTLTQNYIQDPASVDPSLVRPAIALAAANGDAKLFAQLLALSQSANNPDVQTTALFALARFHNPALLRRALDYATSGKVRNQDAVFFFVIALQNRDTRPVAWQYIQDNWDKVHAELTTMMGARLVTAAGGFCTEQKRAEVQGFFATHPVMAADRARRIANDSIAECVQLRAAQQSNLHAWLAQQPVVAQ